MTLELSIIIVSYETQELTLRCLETLYEHAPGVSFEVIVLDNDSKDGSAESIRQRFPGVTLIESKENLGFAGGNNRAAASAQGEKLLLLNPDTEVLDDAITKLYEFSESLQGRTVVGGRTQFADGSLNPGSCWGRPTPWSVFCMATGLAKLFGNSRLFASESIGGWARDSVREVDIVSGCFLLIPRDLWQELGGFDPLFFMYGEDADLCLRARQLGASCHITPEATIIHHGGKSEKARAGKIVRLFRAKSQLFRRYWSPLLARLGCRLLDFWTLVRIVGFRALRLKNRHADSHQTWAEVWKSRREWWGTE